MQDKPIVVPPLHVKPLIKLIRWSCLIAGIIYGIVKHRKYSAIEKVLREEDERLRPAREARLREEKLRRDTAEMRELERIFLGTSAPESEESVASKDADAELNAKEDETKLNNERKEDISQDENKALLNIEEEGTVPPNDQLKDSAIS